MTTAHNIRHIGLAQMSGQHLSEAPNEPRWTRDLPTAPGVFDHRNLENAGGRVPIHPRLMFVGYVNWPEDPIQGHGTKPMPLGSGKLRACRIEHPMTTNSLTVQEWGGEWRYMGRAASPTPQQEKTE